MVGLSSLSSSPCSSVADLPSSFSDGFQPWSIGLLHFKFIFLPWSIFLFLFRKYFQPSPIHLLYYRIFLHSRSIGLFFLWLVSSNGLSTFVVFHSFVIISFQLAFRLYKWLINHVRLTFFKFSTSFPGQLTLVIFYRSHGSVQSTFVTSDDLRFVANWASTSLNFC